MPQYAIGLLTISTLHVYVDRNGSYCRKQGCGVGSGVGVGGGGGANILLEAESESEAMKLFELKSESKTEAIKLLIFQYSILVSSDSTLIVVKGVG